MTDARGPKLPPGADAGAATTGASVLAGGLWQGASRLLPQIYILVLSVAVARFLGAEEFGRQSFIAFVALSATSLFSGGLKVALMRYVGELLGRGEAASVRGLVTWTASLQLIGAVLGGAALVAGGVLGAEPQAAWVLAGLWTAIAVMQTVPNAVLIGAQRFRTPATIGMVIDTISVVSTIAVLVAGGGIAAIFAVQVVTGAMSLIWTTFAARRTIREITSPTDPAPGPRRALLGFAGVVTGGVVLELIVWRRSEFLFLDIYSDDVQIGLYSIAFAASYALILIPQTLAGVVAPAFATLFGAGDERRLRSGYERGMRLLLLGSLPLTAGAVALGPEAIRVVYGEQFADAGPVFLVMAALFPLVPLYSISESLLVGLRRAWAPFLFGSVAAVVNIGLDFALIPRWDALGAALANTGGQITTVIPVIIYAARLTGGVRLHLDAMLRAAAASAAAGLAAWLVLSAIEGVPGLVLGALAGLGVFTALAAALRIVPGEDARWLESVAGERFGGAVGRAARVAAREPSPPTDG